MNQHLLDLIGVGHKSLTQVCHICRSHGLSCKLTGSGGGGCAFAIIRPGKVYIRAETNIQIVRIFAGIRIPRKYSDVQ